MNWGSNGEVTAYQPLPAGLNVRTKSPSLTMYELGMIGHSPELVARGYSTTCSIGGTGRASSCSIDSSDPRCMTA
jgi:hypothetical protein